MGYKLSMLKTFTESPFLQYHILHSIICHCIMCTWRNQKFHHLKEFICLVNVMSTSMVLLIQSI